MGNSRKECFPKPSCKGTARTNQNKETDKEGKKRGMIIERSKAGKK